HVKNTLDSKHVDVRSHATTSFHSNVTNHNDDSCNSMNVGGGSNLAVWNKTVTTIKTLRNYT
ncbi:hypothetical protein, partial [Helicobacter trogontum]|uniref:hypothetical protein n=1 Tax=Helicobacter trogontum TaxID=50960 RepID=UPI0034E87732